MFNLKKIPFFSDLTSQQEKKILSLMEKIEIEPGVELIKEDEVGTEMFILISGQVKIVKRMVKPEIAEKIPFLEENSKVLATLDGKDFPVLGEIALIDSDKRSATVYTLTSCTFLKLTQEKFLSLAHAEPELGLKISVAVSKSLAQKLRQTNGDIVKLTTALALLLYKRRYV
ncbi:MAG: cyclic nucleotide-binding domain-containing protein [Desulfonauticus sp.]|nr:cyclic nucleotide-binding domain-containing protein [Desulfonauticus sp.]